MSYPSSRYEMRRAGYTLVEAKPCDRCKAPTEKWRTGNGKLITMDAPANGGEMEHVDAHRFTCKPKQTNSTFTAQDRQRGAMRLQQTTKARLVIALYDDGAFAYGLRNGISAEDLRQELITAANQLRRLRETSNA